MILRRPMLVLAVTLTTFGITAAVAPAAGSGVTVRAVKNPVLGVILANAAGWTLYRDSGERPNTVRCTGACASTWRPLLVGANVRLIAGAGVKSSFLGKVKRPEGTLQVTYDREPLYLYTGDKKAGEANGQAVENVWHAVRPSGANVTKAATTSTASGSTSSGSGSYSPSPPSSTGGSSGAGSSSGSGSSSSSGNNAAYCASNPMDCQNGVPISNGGNYG